MGSKGQPVDPWGKDVWAARDPASFPLGRGTWSFQVSSALLLSLQGRHWATSSEPKDRYNCGCFQYRLFAVPLSLPGTESAAGWLKSSALLWLNLGATLGYLQAAFQHVSAGRANQFFSRVSVRVGQYLRSHTMGPITAHLRLTLRTQEPGETPNPCRRMHAVQRGNCCMLVLLS